MNLNFNILFKLGIDLHVVTNRKKCHDFSDARNNQICVIGKEIGSFGRTVSILTKKCISKYCIILGEITWYSLSKLLYNYRRYMLK